MRNAMLLTDGYKLDHRRQYPLGTEYVYCNFTPRSNKYYPEIKQVVSFGTQYFCKKLVKYFDENFFNLTKEEVVNSFSRFINGFLGPNNIGTEHVEALYDLGYLPIEIKALKEGSLSPIGCPVLTIINTNPNFYWLPNFLETILSNSLFLPMSNASTARLFLKQLVKHATKTGFNDTPLGFLCHDFSMRGMGSLEDAITSGMAHLTSFTGSETLPAIEAIEEYYNSNLDNEMIAMTVPATEHSVMCVGGDENERETFKRLLTEVYPTGFVSIVSDTWDYWKNITETIPSLHDEIMARDGRFVVRPDSGRPEDIIAGWDIQEIKAKKDYDGQHQYVRFEGSVYDVEWDNDGECYYFDKLDEQPTEAEIKGTYQCLWDEFGGTINETGYKVLDSHVGVIYGDSITLERQKEIYRRLEKKGFAATNLVLGVGSYTYFAKIGRDSLGWAVKATWCQINGEHKDIYKDPKTVVGMPKKSLKGLIRVYNDESGKLYAVDQVPYEEWIKNDPNDQLIPVFRDGKLLYETSLSEIRERLKTQTL
jgi:nicotinamide phosphoribosyltransferase